jgi:hypothetical protein
MSQDIALTEQQVESDGQWCPLPADTCENIFRYKYDTLGRRLMTDFRAD